MKKILDFGALFRLKFLKFYIMSTDGKLYYAVGRGREIGIFSSWEDCKAQVDNFNNAKFRKFYSLEEAEEFVSFWKNYSPPFQEKDKNIAPTNEDFSTKILESVLENDKKTLEPINSEIYELPSQLGKQFESTNKQTLSPCCQCSSSDSKFPIKNVDVLAVNLRLDSFEKRFDACLKEVGAIMSEVSQIKSELQKVKEALSSHMKTQPQKNEPVQSTLKFRIDNKESQNANKSLSKSSISRHYSKRSSNEMDEPVAKRSKVSMRKLSSKTIASSTDSDTDDNCLTQTNFADPESVNFKSFTFDKDEYVEVYTDGACISNGQKGAKAGIGIWFGDNHPLNVSKPVQGPPTNNTAEIQAARIAIQLAMGAGVKKLKIITDSEFLINCATKWIHKWKKNDWTLVDGGKVKNKVELEKLDKISSKIQVRWEKVEAHSGVEGNEMADQLAKSGCENYVR